MSLRFDLEMVISLSMDSQDSQKEFTWGSMSFGQISIYIYIYIYINKGSHKIGLMVLSSFVFCWCPSFQKCCWIFCLMEETLSKVWFRDIYHHSSEIFLALLNVTSLSHGNCQFMMPHRKKSLAAQWPEVVINLWPARQCRGLVRGEFVALCAEKRWGFAAKIWCDQLTSCDRFSSWNFEAMVSTWLASFLISVWIHASCRMVMRCKKPSNDVMDLRNWSHENGTG